ncbi:MAG: hypothetical protein A2516_05235 [Alphaproteobacteria bacterium RIFOXYD12_FULL_60_8]|nr:MAG: hypothetical protein A2516_05235 [Alphaproteobacteria bacterium RIFOXYD12_FULL_60_8]
MTSISLRVSSELSERLSRLAGTHGLTTQECAVQALLEYVENWEGFNRAMAACAMDEDRPRLVANLDA